MKIVANNYKSNEVFKMVREYTGLTQTELAKELNRRSYHGIKNIERGTNKFYFDTLMEIIKKHNLELIIKDKNS